MLKLFITPDSIVFQDLSDYLMHTLERKYGLEFTEGEHGYEIVDKPEYLFKLLYRLTRDYDIEVS